MDFVRRTCPLPSGLHLSYVEWGGEGETPLILLHGLADHALVWQGIAGYLYEHLGKDSERIRLLAPDLRGHGESSKPASVADYDSRLLAGDLEVWAARLGLGTVEVVAHSWSAKVALLWAQQYRDRIARLVLVDPFFVNRFPAIWRPAFPLLYRLLPFLKVMGPFPSYEAAESVARGLKQYQGWQPWQALAFESGMVKTPQGEWVSQFTRTARDGVFLDTLRVTGLAQEVTTLTCLILPEAGLNRQAFQLKPYRRYLTHLSERRVVGNHWPHLVAPEALADAIADYLNLDP